MGFHKQTWQQSSGWTFSSVWWWRGVVCNSNLSADTSPPVSKVFSGLDVSEHFSRPRGPEASAWAGHKSPLSPTGWKSTPTDMQHGHWSHVNMLEEHGCQAEHRFFYISGKSRNLKQTYKSGQKPDRWDIMCYLVSFSLFTNKLTNRTLTRQQRNNVSNILSLTLSYQ